MSVINDIYRLSQSRSRPGDFELKYYRGVFGLFALAYFFSYFLFKNQVLLSEFILPRPWLSFIPIGLIVSSYFSKFVKQNISTVAGAFFLLATLHLMGFFYTNEFKTRYELAIITLVLFSNLHLERVLFVVLYNVIVLSVLEYLFILYAGSGITPFLFFVFVLTVMLICVSYQLYRLRIQRALANREKLLTDIFNQSNDAWMLFDIYAEQAVDANEKALQLFQLERNQLTERFGLANVLGKEFIFSSLPMAIEQGEFLNKEFNLQTANGNDIWLNISFARIPDSPNLIYCRFIDISTERKQRESSEAKALEVRYFLENIDEGVVVCNDNHEIKLISKNLCELLGYSMKTLLNDNKLFSILQNDFSIEIANKEFVKKIETKYVSPQGKEIWLQFSGRKIKSPVDEEEVNLWVARNITGNKMREVSFDEPQPELKNIFDEGHFGVSIIGTNQRILKANQAFANILGYSERELDKLSLIDLSHPHDIIGKSDDMESVLLKKHTSLKREKRFIRKDGRVVWTNFTASLIQTASVSEQQVIVLIEDITPRKKIEQELNLANTNITALIESTEDAICSIDFNHTIIVINNAFIDKFYFENKVKLRKGMNFKDALNESQKHKWISLHSEAMKGKHVTDEEIISFYDGSQKYYETSLHPVFEESGIITGVTYFSRDLTDRKKFEGELLKAKEEAERATTVKSQFLATMSHEIRTPLSGLIGMLDLLSDTKLNTQQQEYLKTIQLSGEALLQIINDVLDYSKIESENMAMDMHPFNLKKCVEETYDILYYKAQEKNIDLLYDIDTTISNFIIGDKARLRQILINLVGNAIKFTTKGHILISITKNKNAGSNDELQFAVKDTGIGITEEQINRLFKAFSQADSTTYGKYGGTGLGLAISSRLVALMGGKIWVTSEPGEGSTFYFTIKTNFADGHEKINEEVRQEITYEKYLPEKIGKKTEDHFIIEPVKKLAEQIPVKILVAEDNEVNQKVIEIILSRLGYQPFIVSNGLAVLEIMGKEKFDLIFMDVQMPELDGLETTQEIVKILPHGKRPIIIAMTAFAMEGDKQKCMDAGMDDYISKPVKIEEISEMISKWASDAVVENADADRIENEMELIDQNAFDRIKKLGGENDTVFLSQVIGMFLKQAPVVIDDILENEKNGNIEKMEQAAHKLKGSSLNIGAKKLASICREIELKTRNNELKDMVKLTAVLKNIFQLTEIELKKQAK